MCGEQDTHRDAAAGASPGKKPKDGSVLEGDEDEEDVDVMIEDGDELTHEDMATFHDIVCSWLKKVVKHVIINVLLESDMNLEICAPFTGGLFRKGISQQDIDTRMVKLAVRCKGMVKALAEACNAADMSEAIISFLQRLVAHRQKYPSPKLGASLAGRCHSCDSDSEQTRRSSDAERLLGLGNRGFWAVTSPSGG